MYDVAEAIPGTDFTEARPGTSLLVTGNTHRAHDLTLDLLTRGPATGEAAILITTNESAETVLADVDERGVVDTDLIGILDCTTGADNRLEADVPVAYLSTPGDLTGISLEFAKLVDRLNPTELRVGLSSISTILMYAEVETTFRFLHVFCSRARSGGWFAVFTIDPEMHDDEVVNTIRALFDCEIRLREEGLDVRGAGLV